MEVGVLITGLDAEPRRDGVGHREARVGVALPGIDRPALRAETVHLRQQAAGHRRPEAEPLRQRVVEPKAQDRHGHFLKIEILGLRLAVLGEARFSRTYVRPALLISRPWSSTVVSRRS